MKYLRNSMKLWLRIECCSIASTNYGKCIGSINLEIMLYRSCDLLLTVWVNHPSTIYTITAFSKTKEYSCHDTSIVVLSYDLF